MTLQERLAAAHAKKRELEQQHAQTVEDRNALNAKGVALEKQLWKNEGEIDTLTAALAESN